MDRIVIRIHIPKLELSAAVEIKAALEKLLEDLDAVEVELSAFTIRE